MQFCDIKNLNYKLKTKNNTHFNSILENLIQNNANLKNELEEVINIINDCNYWLEKEFLNEYEYTFTRGEKNYIKYKNLKKMLLGIGNNADFVEALSSIIIAKLANIKIHVSFIKDIQNKKLLWLRDNIDKFLTNIDMTSSDSESSFIRIMRNYQKIRFLNSLDVLDSFYEASAMNHSYINVNPFIKNARLELLNYFIEQSISNSFHRYGNLGAHAIKKN